MRAYKYVWILLLLLAGCASLGLAPAQSFDQRLAYVQSGVTSARTSVAHALAAGTLKSADGQKALELTDEARAAVEAARTAQVSGDTTTAQQKLMLATSVLTQLQSYLQARGVK